MTDTATNLLCLGVTLRGVTSLPARSLAAPYTLALLLLATAGCNTPPRDGEPPSTATAPLPPAPTAAAPPPTAAAPPQASASAEPPPGAPRIAESGEMCGGIAGIPCQAGLYCFYPPEAHCGASDQSGTCRVVPEFCTREYAPVCACNDKTYSNACSAAAEGVSVSRTGECSSGAAAGATPPTRAEGHLCGARGLEGDCAEGLYCAYRRNCGADDSGGICTKKPTGCRSKLDPVCGCDNKTYGNACEANMASVTVAKPGKCPP